MASNNFWFHKYPFTDFHELDLSFLLDALSSIDTKVIELNERVDAVESTVASLTDRMDTAEDKIETLEGQMSTALDDISDHETRIASIEGSDIMDAVMLRNVGTVDANAQRVRINYVKDTYSDGAKTAGADYADIPSATTESAGVITPTEKAKLNAYSVDANGNATFEGTVSGEAPVGNANFATKAYVDSVVIAGSAQVTYNNDIAIDSWYTNNVTPDSYSERSGVSAYQWGNYTEIDITKQFTFTNDNITSGAQEITHITLASGYIPASGFRERTVMARRTRNGVYDYVPIKIVIEPTNQNSRLKIMNMYGVSWQTGDVLYFDRTDLSYLL